MKQCPSCNIIKGLDEFPPRKTSISGRASWCRECTNTLKRARNKDGSYYDTQSRYYEMKYHGTRRKVIFAKDYNQCVKCGSSEHLEVHHKHNDGGKILFNSTAELTTLCRSCHRSKSALQRWKDTNGTKV